VARRGVDWYPVFLDLQGIPVLVVGGGAVALRKVKGLVQAGADVTVVAPALEAGFRRLKIVHLLRRGFREADLRNACLVFAATNQPQVNARVAAAALERGVWTNVAAPPEAGNLLVPAALRRGRLCVAISTGGASAAAAKALRLELEKSLDAAWSGFLELLEGRRARVLATVHDATRRRRLLQALGRAKWVKRIRAQGREAAARAMDKLIDLETNGRMRRTTTTRPQHGVTKRTMATGNGKH